ncbi:MAG: fructose-bisphosphate aldolase [Mycobacteriaceae bacterium]|nr:fructose-bisphosphate aldolase [Mycobacteriaceae bacterium]
MPLIPMSTAVEAARPGGLCAFNVVTLEHAEAVASAAEAVKRPVVLQISENTAAYHGRLAPLALACVRIAADSTADLVVHLDHAVSIDLIHEAVGLGIRSVMFDASQLPHQANIAATADVASWCRRRDVHIEAELGEVGGKDGVHAPTARTDPVEAAAYVASTGVDALAVAVGSSHAMTTRTAALDDLLIARLAAAVPVPLVLHGSSGVADDGLVSAVRNGMVKINIATHLNTLLTARIRDEVTSRPALVDPRRYLAPARAAMAAEIERLLLLLAGTDR